METNKYSRFQIKLHIATQGRRLRLGLGLGLLRRGEGALGPPVAIGCEAVILLFCLCGGDLEGRMSTKCRPGLQVRLSLDECPLVGLMEHDAPCGY